MRVIKSHFKNGFMDVLQSMQRFNMAFFFAWSDTKARYRRSFLGPFWMVLSTLVSVVGLGTLWSILLHQEASYLIPSLTIGLVVWQFLSGCILEAPNTFVRNTHFIKNIATPYFFFALTSIIKQLINFAHNLLIVLLVLIIYPPNLSLVQLLIIPGLLLVIGNLCWIILLVAIIGARYRDVEQMIGAVMPILFFLSPVIYHPSQVTIAQYIVWLNPFSYFISLIRDPLMGVAPPLFVYQVALLVLIGGVITTHSFGRKRDQIAFWI